MNGPIHEVTILPYPVVSLTSLLLPSYASAVNRFAMIPERLGEGSIVLWLLIKGAKVQPSAAPAS